MFAVLIICFAIFSFMNCASSDDSKQASDELGDVDTKTNGETDDPLIHPGEKHFANMRQLTFEGENAEAYFSADGTKLIFQAHVEEDDCDQIYVMDIETGEKTLVSTGGGATTCSYFQYPNDDKIIYASTHLAGEECPDKYDQGGGYVWTLHPEFDIFRADPDGTNVEQLTDEWGYDAEGTYAHDGSSIVYTSIASGDLEIWTMNPDGSGKVQLTDRLGYDGGPFFSWDSSKIVWRAFYPETETEIAEFKSMLEANAIKPMALQIWVMDTDGSNKIQVTDNQGANFCPFFLPGDDRVIYASNHSGKSPMDFNLWVINIDGTGVEQLTFYEGFDGFPMFSPDGKKLAFCSNRNQAKPGDTNVFICDWVE